MARLRLGQHMAAAAGLLNHQSVAQSLVGKTTPMTGSTTATSGADAGGSTSDDSATISANDFLTLLVTEMQNQDPTADTDPNEYINQLVEVNSLEQLININQTLTTDLGSPETSDASPADGSSSTQARSATASPPASASAATHSTAARMHAATQASQLPAVAQTPGNLGIPAADASAQRVAHSLYERTRAHPATAPPVIP